jgi:hypothetical protein
MTFLALICDYLVGLAIAGHRMAKISSLAPCVRAVRATPWQTAGLELPL